MKAQDLKNSILQMAMEGKLVPQDPNDEPASVLLERIKEEKERLIKEKKIKKNNKESVIFRKNNHFYEKVGKKSEEVCIDDKIPWDIPNSWEWCKLGNLISIIAGISYKKGDVTSEGLRVLRGGNIQDTNVVLLNDDVYLPESYYDPIKEIKKGDILIVASTGSKKVIGKPGFVNENYENISIGAFLRICRPVFNYLSEYIQLIFASKYYRNHIRTLSQGTNINNVKKEYLENLFVPLPPLKEQEMILTKINHLLPLINDYGANQEELETLNNEFPNKIKDSILQEAIQGKLVSQNPNDEPASVLLKSIKEEKEQLIKAKKIKRNKNESFIFKENNHFYEKVGKNEPVCIDDKIPFEIPNNWQWCRMENIVQLISGRDMKSNEYNDEEQGIPYITGASNIENNDLIINRWIENPGVISIKNDILLTCKGTIGKLFVLNEPKVHIARQIMAIRIFDENLVIRGFILLILEYYVNKLQNIAKSMIPGISRDDVLKILVPLPPLNEQKNIVIKNEELLNIFKKFIH